MALEQESQVGLNRGGGGGLLSAFPFYGDVVDGGCQGEWQPPAAPMSVPPPPPGMMVPPQEPKMLQDPPPFDFTEIRSVGLAKKMNKDVSARCHCPRYFSSNSLLSRGSCKRD